MKRRSRVVVAMSGGVDSAVSAWLLKRQGYEVVGLYAQCWDEEGSPECLNMTCDFEDMAYTASVIDIPYERVDLSDLYRQLVFEDLIAGYAQGITPNPDILCNQHIKFCHLYHTASQMGMDYFATGHYVQQIDGQLYKGMDPLKDQSYFLYAINDQILSQLLFPVGKMTKTHLRQLAVEAQLPVAHKKDSMGICFVGQHKFSEFLARYIPENPGDFVDVDGQVVGQHRGAHLYTVGQRRGLGLGGAGDRWYVMKKHMDSNQVVVHRGDHEHMYTDEVILDCCHFLGWTPETHQVYDLSAKIRHGSSDRPCVVDRIETLDSNSRLYTARVRFCDLQKALSAGQSVVFYDQNRLIGGGIIKNCAVHESSPKI